MDEALDYHSRQLKRVKNPPTAAQRKIFRRAYLASSGIVAAGVALVLWMYRVDPYGGTQILMPDLLLLWGGICVVGAMMVLWIVRVWGFQESASRRMICSISIVVPLALLGLTFVLVEYEVPFRRAFALSRAAIEKAALEVRADPTKKGKGRWAGVMPIKSIQVVGADIVVAIGGAENFDTEPCLIWHPGGAPPFVSAYSIKALGNDWYWVNR